MSMRSTRTFNSSIKTDKSRVSHSKLSLSMYEFWKLESEMKKVQYPTHAISNAQDLKIKINSFKNSQVREELGKKLKDLNSYRQVRGDGNCFFRALAFSFISATTQPSFKNCFGFIEEVSLTCCFSASIPKDFQKFYNHEFLVETLKKNWESKYLKCYQSADKIVLKALLKLFSEFPYLDFIVVLYFRALCLKALSKYENDFKQYLVGSEEEAIRTYSEETEGVALHLCSRMLGIKIYVYEVRKDEVHSYKYIEVEKEIAKIYLLFYESHYDIIEVNDHIKAEDSVLKDKAYYSDVNEKMTEGTCFECDKKGYVYMETGLCLKCHEYSLTSLKNFSQVDRYVPGKCSQCYHTRDQISESLGLCKKCIQIQSNYEKVSEEKTKFGRCLNCEHRDNIFIETSLCKICTREKKKLAERYEERNQKKENGDVQKSQLRRPPQSQPEYKYGSCVSCKFSSSKISVETCLCWQCEHAQKKMMGSISPSKRRSPEKPEKEIPVRGHNSRIYSERNECKSCKFMADIDPETRMCGECTVSKIPQRYKCKGCYQDFSRTKSLFSEGDAMCIGCLKTKNIRKEFKDNESVNCIKCGNRTHKYSLVENVCIKCKDKALRNEFINCIKCGKMILQSEAISRVCRGCTSKIR